MTKRKSAGFFLVAGVLIIFAACGQRAGQTSLETKSELTSSLAQSSSREVASSAPSNSEELTEEDALATVKDTLSRAEMARIILAQNVDILEEKTDPSGQYQAVNMEAQTVPGLLDILETFHSLEDMSAYYHTIFEGNELDRRINGYYETATATPIYVFIDGKLYINAGISPMPMGITQWDKDSARIVSVSSKEIVALVRGVSMMDLVPVEKELSFRKVEGNWVVGDGYAQ